MADLRPAFWDLPLADLTRPEWEALCDGCAKCCALRVRHQETGEVSFTRLVCKLMDPDTCRCTRYADRKVHVPHCIVMDPAIVGDILAEMPQTCAYRLRHEGQPLPSWHPLLTGDPASVHHAGASVRGVAVPLPDDLLQGTAWQAHIIEEPGTHGR